MGGAEKKQEREERERKNIPFDKLIKEEALDKVLRPALPKYNLPEVITRRQWKARYSSGTGCVDRLEFPLTRVIVTHTESDPCGDVPSCSLALRGLQTYFMRLGYHDLPYSFVVTHEGAIFEGRSWLEECLIPLCLGDQSKTLVIGIVGKSSVFHGPVKDLVEGKVKAIIDHGITYDMIDPKFNRLNLRSWHYRFKHKPGYELSSQVKEQQPPISN